MVFKDRIRFDTLPPGENFDPRAYSVSESDWAGSELTVTYGVSKDPLIQVTEYKVSILGDRWE